MRRPEDINQLEKRIAKFKNEQAPSAWKTSTENDEYSRTAVGFQISTELLAGVLIGAGLGYVLDKFFSTQPWLLVVLTILGGAAGILNIYRTFKAEEKGKK